MLFLSTGLQSLKSIHTLLYSLGKSLTTNKTSFLYQNAPHNARSQHRTLTSINRCYAQYQLTGRQRHCVPLLERCTQVPQSNDRIISTRQQSERWVKLNVKYAGSMPVVLTEWADLLYPTQTFIPLYTQKLEHLSHATHVSCENYSIAESPPYCTECKSLVYQSSYCSTVVTCYMDSLYLNSECFYSIISNTCCC